MWLNSKEFAQQNTVSVRTIQNKIKKLKTQKFLSINAHFYVHLHTDGIGGNSGKVLKIWSEPFATEEEAQAFINGDGASATSTALLENVEDFSKAGLKKQNFALSKEHIIKQWEKAKRKGISARSFIESINAGLDSIKFPLPPKLLPLSENKLYAWQRAYKEKGLLGLLDKRGSKRESSVKTLGIEPLVVELLEARRGSINISSLHNILHMRLDSMGIFDYRTYIAKEGEYVSYTALRAYVQRLYEAGKGNITLENLNKIARALDINMAYFLSDYLSLSQNKSVVKSNFAPQILNKKTFQNIASI